MARFTRGFSGRGQAARDPRLPPGQYDAGRDWPVLTAEVTPRLSTDTWTFSVDGLVGTRRRGRGTRSTTLAASTYDGDIHCVTTWSKLGMTFDGRLGRHAARRSRGPLPTATHVLAFSHTGYTTNLRWPTSPTGTAWIVVGGRRSVRFRRSTAARRGCSCRTSTSGRARSGSRGLRLLDHDEPGFWERNGYHDRGDPWLEQRYQGD